MERPGRETTSANIISLGLQMIETQTGKIVWTASSTKAELVYGTGSLEEEANP
jgi:hypothetical protein